MRMLVAHALTFLVFFSTTALLSAQSNTEIEIDQVLEQVQGALVDAQKILDEEGFPTLSTVKLTLQTEIKKEAGGKFKFLIFSFGKTWSREKSQQLELTLKPSADTDQEISNESLRENIVQAILSAAQGIQDSTQRDPPLDLSEFKATFSFVVQSNGTGSGEFTILPVTVELKGDLSKKALHKVELHFKAAA